MSPNGANKLVCFTCVGEDYLKDKIRNDCVIDVCSYCGGNRNCIEIDELASLIHDAIDRSYYMTSNEPEGLDYLLAKEGYWEQPGQEVVDLIGEIARVDSPIAADVCTELSDRYGHAAAMDGGDDPYGSDAMYEEKKADDWVHRKFWNQFKLEVQTKSRFYSKAADVALDEFFGHLDELKSHGGGEIVRNVGPNTTDRFIYRARVADSLEKMEGLLESPARELGPPPPALAAAGRMNAKGISVFYGAFEVETCLAEARAPVGSSVVTAQFEITRELRLLDFNALAGCFSGGSVFDPASEQKWGREAFLRSLVDEISRPIMPHEEDSEYLPTQIVAEYLYERLDTPVDGLIFRSPQTAGNGQNVVLFNHASKVEAYDLPDGSDVNISHGWGPPEDHDDCITIFESVPKPSEEDTGSKEDPDDIFGSFATPVDYIPGSGRVTIIDSRDTTLRIDANSIQVFEMRGVTYETHERSVLRHRNEKSDGPEEF